MSAVQSETDFIPIESKLSEKIFSSLDQEEGIWKTTIRKKKGLQVSYVLSEKQKQLFFQDGWGKIYDFLNTFQFSLEDKAFSFTIIAKMHKALVGKKDLVQEVSQTDFQKKFSKPTRLDSYFDASNSGRHTLEESDQWFSSEIEDFEKFLLAERLLVQILIPLLDLSQSYFCPIPIVRDNNFIGCDYYVYELSKISKEKRNLLHS